MIESVDKKVQDFLEQTRMVDDAKYQIVEALRKIVFEHYPKTMERIMYGGILFSLTDDYGGVFVYKNHVSFEFSLGYQFKDPEKLLEGGGKYRRHLKFRSMEDIEAKKVDFYINQIKEVET